MRCRLESLAVTKLSLFRDDELLGPGTGFFYRYGQDVGLVTNWHVLTAVNPLTNKPLTKSGRHPNRVEFHINIFEPSGKELAIRGEQAILIDEGQCSWWQHKGYPGLDGQPKTVDIAVLPLKTALADYAEVRERIVSIPAHVLVNVDQNGQPESFELGYPRVGADVFILGYPRGLTKQGVLPIWKRGSIASEPLYHVLDGTPAMFVDAVTREGMSGSPVLYFGTNLTDDQGRNRSGIGKDDALLVGVYAGREGVTGEEVEMTLGRVWHRKALDEIFFDEYRERGKLTTTK